MRKTAIVLLLCLTIFAGCAKDGGITLDPAQVDWQKTSDYYAKYVMGFLVPVGSTVAAIAIPEAAPLIALAAQETSRLDALIKAKANDATIAEQAALVQATIVGINQIVGEARK